MPIPQASVSVDVNGAEASFCLSDAQMPDLGNLLGGLWGGGVLDGEGRPLPPVFSSTISLQAHWFQPGQKQRLRDPVNQFVYENAQSNASIKWASVRRGASFVTDSNPQTVLFAALGAEKNGVFFS